MNYKPFGYQDEPLTCLWCGRKLSHHTVIDEDREKAARAAGMDADAVYQHSLVRAEKAGPYQDDSFCTLSCGYLFGLRLAELGSRLESK